MSAAHRTPAVTDGTLDRESFGALFRRHPAGVAVITLTDGPRPVGFTATSVISVSAQPPVLAFSINDTSSSWPVLGGTSGWISGRILDQVPAGGSHLVIVAADRAEIFDEEPLVYRNRTYHQLLEYEI